MERIDLTIPLQYINPAELDYQEWVNVGMALKQEGYPAAVWDDWSRNDRRYHAGECEKKWRTFQGNASPVTGGTIMQMAMDRGWRPDPAGHELDWDDEIDNLSSRGWTEPEEFHEPADWNPGAEVSRYLDTLFEPGETIGYCMQSRYDEERDKYIPRNKGIYTKTAGELRELISKYKGDIGSAFGDYDPKAGAWIRFNPLDGEGVRNINVSDYRYALVESDSLDLEMQNAKIRELELPVAVLMFSGGKSLHAIVRIDAVDYKEYQKRVEYLYSVCEKSGLSIDTQNKNPSRLSRLPGCMRGDRKQYIIDTNIGKKSYEEWKEYIDSINDDLPDFEGLSDVWDRLPELADPLIDGLLRKGHKMLIAGPSKAGKSFLQIELVIAIAEGRQWLQWKCAQGNVLYVNLELDRASCLHRFRDVYTCLGWAPESLRNIDIWNLRGKSIPMDKLAPKLIRRAQKRNYSAIIIDPIYKVITGDENSAEQMAKFCNQFDRVCTELGSAIIYCHHHSKGSQGQKRSMDRASGSGVFARDPDAQLDMIELEVSEDLRKQEINKAVCGACIRYLDANWKWQNDLSQDDMLNAKTMVSYCENTLNKWQWQALNRQIEQAAQAASTKTAWRLEATLREFQTFDPVNVWFNYPVHRMDDSGVLTDSNPENEAGGYQKMIDARKKKAEQERADNLDALTIAFEGLEKDGVASAIEIAEEIGVSADSIKRWFGNGKRARKEYKKLFDTYEDKEDKRLYLKRKTTTDE